MIQTKIDEINIALILISLFLAFKLPFELFLFSYAVLGPLHYLTEINWLEEKKFFVKNKQGIWFIVFLTLLITIVYLISQPYFSKFTSPHYLALFNKQTNVAIFSALIFSLFLLYSEKLTHLIIAAILSIGLSFFILHYIHISKIIVGVFIPTIIHVYIFTLLFMLLGAMTNKSKYGIVATFLLLAVPLIIYFSNLNPNHYNLSDKTKINFSGSGFQNVSGSIAHLIGSLEDGQFYLLSVSGIKIQIFIAFCYTYHYLNWFSKTNIIGWNKNLSKNKKYSIFLLWILSIFLYWYDYKLGFSVLFMLSFLHVLLEFPLNIKSITGIYKELMSKILTTKKV